MKMRVNPLTGRSYEQECKGCGKPFVTGNATQLYCVQSCGITCKHCGKPFETSHRDRGKPSFCSRKCRSDAAVVEVTCAICGKKWKQNRHGGLKDTCSKKCRYELASRSAIRDDGHHYNWKGGRRVDENGYVHVYAPDHPKANGKYILEHRLLMEQSLGRELLASEDVHHKNGERSDNRLTKGHELRCPSTCCNLELWTKSHPRGQRVADKLAWAKGLLAQYEPASLVA